MAHEIYHRSTDREHLKGALRQLLECYWGKGDDLGAPPPFIARAIRMCGYQTEPPADRRGWVRFMRRSLVGEAPSMRGEWGVPIDEVQAGDTLLTDDGFTCVKGGTMVTVHKDKCGELYFRCSRGQHTLAGQEKKLPRSLGGHWVYTGLLKVPPQKGKAKRHGQ